MGEEEGKWGGGNLGLYIRKGGGKSEPSGVHLNRTACLLPKLDVMVRWPGRKFGKRTIEFSYTWDIHNLG